MAGEVQSVLRAFALLRMLAAHTAPVPLGAIAAETRLPKSTISRLLATLESIAMVERGDVGGTYTVGAGVDALTGRSASRAQLVAAARPYLAELVDRYAEDAVLTVADGPAVLFVDQVPGPNPVSVRDWRGIRLPPHTVAAGHVTMGSWTDEELEAYVAAPLVATTDRTVTDPEQLRERVRTARTAGYAWTLQEWAEGINGVAAPVCGPGGRLVAVVNLYGPAYRFPGAADREAIGRDLATTANRVARHLGGDEGDAGPPTRC